jgi:hypothetical protein
MRLERIRKRRERAWRRWRLLRAVPILAWRAWVWLMRWDAVYQEEARSSFLAKRLDSGQTAR